MKPVSLAAQLAAAETELACLKIALGQVKEDREELRQERDAWRREATKLYAEKLIAEKLIEADEGRFAPRSTAHGETPRIYRTSRTTQFNARATPQTVEAGSSVSCTRVRDQPCRSAFDFRP